MALHSAQIAFSKMTNNLFCRKHIYKSKTFKWKTKGWHFSLVYNFVSQVFQRCLLITRCVKKCHFKLQHNTFKVAQWKSKLALDGEKHCPTIMDKKPLFLESAKTKLCTSISKGFNMRKPLLVSEIWCYLQAGSWENLSSRFTPRTSFWTHTTHCNGEETCQTTPSFHKYELMSKYLHPSLDLDVPRWEEAEPEKKKFKLVQRRKINGVWGRECTP